MIKQCLVPTAKYNIKCPHTMKAEYITVHNTSNDASAENEIKYMSTNNNQVSYHFAVDDKEVIQGLPLDRNGWHCGDGNGNGNRKSIGIEICYSKSGGERYTKAEENTVVLIAQLLKERGWGTDRVKQHYDWSKKNCPHRIRNEKRWDGFLKRIEDEMNKKTGPKENEEKMEQPLFVPPSNTAKKEIFEYIEGAHKRGIINSHSWVDKLKNDKLTLSEWTYIDWVIRTRSNEEEK